MKTGKLFTIDVEIAERLQNLNASQLVNELLKEYFEAHGTRNTIKERKEAIFKQLIKKKSNFPRKLRSLMNGIDLTWIIIRRHGLKQGKKILQDLKSLNISVAEKLTHYLNSLNRHGNYLLNTGKYSNEKK